MPRAVVKDRAAESDLVEIWIYTIETWSESQAERYLSELKSGIGALAHNPEDGTRRDALRPGYWSTRIRHHIVFYTFTDREIRIRRVLHEVMDVDQHL